jgi:hypothetical protein
VIDLRSCADLARLALDEAVHHLTKGAHVPDATCPACTRPQVQGLLCHACTSTLEYELGEVVTVLTELDTTLAKQGRDGASAHSGVAFERSGYHAGASLAVDYLTNTLTTWARDLSNDTWRPQPPRYRVRRNPDARNNGPFCLRCTHASCAAVRIYDQAPTAHPAVQASHYLLAEMPTLRKHGAASEAYDEIVAGIRQARATADRAANRTIINVGPCPEAGADGCACPGEVFAFIPTEDERPARMECKADSEHKWTSIQWLRTGRRILDRIEQRKREAVFGKGAV